jgi:hypothetical protein
VPFLPEGPSCPLQTILLSDLVGCDSPLQIEMAVFKCTSAICQCYLQQAVTRDIASSDSKTVCQTAITICRGLSHRLDGNHRPMRTYLGIFPRTEKPSEEINSCLFLLNKKGLRWSGMSGGVADSPC